MPEKYVSITFPFHMSCSTMWFKTYLKLLLLSTATRTAFATIDNSKLTWTIASRENRYDFDHLISIYDGGKSLYASGFQKEKCQSICVTIHGIAGNRSDEFNQDITKGLQLSKKEQCSYLVKFDYRYYAASPDNYLDLAYKTLPEIGSKVQEGLTYLHRYGGCEYSSMTLFGFFFGATVAGQAGYALKRMNEELGTIVALEQIGLLPCDYPYTVKSGYARVVVALYCSTLSFNRPTGDYNYYINPENQIQPQCDRFRNDPDPNRITYCSSYQCPRIFASFLAGIEYPARCCNSVVAAQRGQCSSTPSTFVGNTNEGSSQPRKIYAANITGCALDISCPPKD